MEGKPGALFYQVIHNRVVRQVSTDYRLYPAEWDEETETVVVTEDHDDNKRHAHLKEVARHIAYDKERFEKAIALLKSKSYSYSADDVVKGFNEMKKHLSLRQFTEDTIAELRSQGKARTADTYKATLRSFMRFRNDEDLMLDELDASMMAQYEASLKNSGATLNTISFYNRILRAIYNRAVEKGYVAQQFPFAKVYTGIAKTTKRGITMKHLAKIRSLALPDGSSFAFARDIFLFSFYTRGMSLIDIAHLNFANIKNGMLTYCRRKTGQRLSVKWLPCMQAIVDRHHIEGESRLLPIIIGDEDTARQYDTALHRINANLKKIGEMIGSPILLTMYVARHSWASAAKASGISLSVISEGMGHDSERTTQIYLASLEASTIDDANELILKKLK